ncbi:MurR/RpiR family transcriptional regulator [Vagococcus fluvialis]|uniref:MurR/RpiR family transcriptional regulator n=1 Tax=Vagococcus fluvialis TaxID=2738 RepID=UPI001A8EBFA6|nr:MurR/RpiR family transcriptional regulator [Vagococcus fluvialis]MBO0488163.1 MurR/RpiR family transcriptional regulator [Vagococcus fluvialis]
MIHEKLTNQEDMSLIEQSIATFFLNEPESLQKLSARKISKKIFVAPSTITRFCKKIGYSGYNEFKEAYVSEYSYLQSHFKKINPNRPFEMKESPWRIANKISQLYTETLSDTLDIQDYELLEKAVNLLNNSKKIYIYSVGNHINLANHFKSKMNEIGKTVEVISRFDTAFYNINYASKEDVFLLISYSGETNDIVRLLDGIKNKEISTLGVTSFGDNTLSQFVDVVLRISTRERLINNSGNFSSDVSVMYLLDVLFASIFSKDYENILYRRNKIAKSYQKYRYSANPLIKD